MALTQRLGLLRSLIIYYGNPWRTRQMRAFYAQFVRPGDLCFDIGAHVGNRTAVWSALGAQVVALEPQTYLMAFLQRQFGSRAGITLREEAAGAEPGRALLHLNPRNPTVASLSSAWIDAVKRDKTFAGVRWDDEVSVPVTTLDALVSRYGRPAFCKIDVEGYELDVLHGLSQPLPALSFEFIAATPDLTAGCVARLEELGSYQYNWTAGEQQKLREARWLRPQALLAQLDGAMRAAGSGDIYARLCDPIPSA